MAASCLKVQQMALVNVCSIPSFKLPPIFFSKSVPSAICRMSSETRSTKRMSRLHWDGTLALFMYLVFYGYGYEV